jgi:protein-tyrosine phosphatase
MNDKTLKIFAQPGANIKIQSVPNLRDVGGWPTLDGGRVRSGLMYRGTELGKLQGDDLTVFANLGIRSIYDLRTEAERSAQPDNVVPGTQYIVLDLLKDSSEAAPAQLMKALSDPKAAAEMLGGGKAVELFVHAYRQVVSLPSALAGYRIFFTDLLNEAHRPVYFHCTTGKDRTGWVAAALLTLLGVPDNLVMQDYLLTNEQLLPALKPVFDHFQSLGGDPELLRPILGVQEEYLEAAFDVMHQRFGTIQSYFADGLGLDQTVQDALRKTFVEHI